MNIEDFQTDLQQEVRLLAETEGKEASLGSAFTRVALDILVDAGEAEDPRVTEADFTSKRMKISAFDWDADRGILSVYNASYFVETNPSNVTKVGLRSMFAQAERFVSASVEGLYRDLEESSDVFDAAQFIFDCWREVRAIRLVALFNSELRTDVPATSELNGLPVRYDVWDIERIRRLASSGKTQEPVDVDLAEFGLHEGLSALGPFSEPEYDVYMLVLPGEFLADIYEEFGPRLLELNVRSFLQARGKTNQGMQKTIKETPERFLAYNNGLSMTASSVVRSADEKGMKLRLLEGVQIVNGGQTTASMFYASRKSNLDLSRVLVQAKLTVVSDGVRSEFAPLISRYANTQNQVRMADFSANDAFHVELEKISRATWAPAGEGTHEMSHWFYERSRGQYADALGRERTPAQKRKFSAVNPRKQLFTKTDVAKYEHAWSQLPDKVALGAEKNFNEFTQQLAEKNSKALPDSVYFQHLVAKAIMWKQTEAVVNSIKLGGYRSAVVAYTIALLSNRTSMKVDLAKIWQRQSVSDLWSTAVGVLAPLVHAELISSAGTRNVLEWAKKKECWEQLRSIEWVAPDGLADGTASSASRIAVALSQAATSLPASEEEIEGRELMASVGADNWFAIAAWAKETSNLQPWQRGLSFSIGQAIGRSKLLSAKQVIQGKKILVEVERLGFKLQE